MAKLELEDPAPIFKCFKCNESFDSLYAWKKHIEKVEHTSSNNSKCARCGQVWVKVESTGRVAVGDKGPKVYCKNCIKAITEEAEESEETEVE